MRNLIIAALTILTAHAAHAFQVEVAPLALQTQAQVVGMKNKNAQGLVIVTGQTAQQVAIACGTPFDPASQMLILTGPEVNVLIRRSAAVAYNSGYMTVVATSTFAAETLAVTMDIVANGGATILGAAVATVGTGAMLAVNALTYLSANAVYLVVNTGTFFFNAGYAIVGGVVGGVVGVVGGVASLIWAPVNLVGLALCIGC